MGKILSERERKLQKKLIPLNIFVCILALVAVFTLMFMPILTIDFGKILRSEEIIELVDKSMNNAVNGSVGSLKSAQEDGKEENGESGSAGAEVDFMPVISAVVANVLGKAEGSVTISSFSAAKVAFASGDDKAEMVLDELFLGDEALVSKLIDSIAQNMVGMFNEDAGKAIIEEVVVKSIATSLIAGLSDGASEKLTDENVTALTNTFKKLDSVTDSEGAEAVANEFVDHLDEILGDDFDKEADGEAVREYIMNMYDDTTSVTDDFSVEAMIAIAVSKNVDLSENNMGGAFGGSQDGEPEQEPARKRLTEGEIGEGGTLSPDESGENDEKDPIEGSGSEDDKTPQNPPVSGGDNEDGVICTTYAELLAQMGIDENNMEELKANLKTTLHNFVDEAIGEFSEYFGYYGYLFYGMLAFMVPWLILFLFSFFHMFAKNKRFMMWYVKLYSFIPGLISLVLILAPRLLPKFMPDLFEGENGGLINALLGGVSSFMWISGICYVLLWLVSIFWAFPIKHKIRKERKYVKTTGLSYGDSTYESGKKDKKSKNKKSKNNKADNYDRYYNSYDGNSYSGSSYGDSYGGSYGGSSYGDSYGDSYDSYGGGGYGSSYGSGYYDDDLDGFDAPYTGSYYGSSLYDDDDDDDY